MSAFRKGSVRWAALSVAATLYLTSGQGIAGVISINNGNPLAAQYYNSQAYAEIKDSNGNNLTDGGRIANGSSSVGSDSQSGALSNSGASSVYNTLAAVDGFARTRTSASVAVTNSGPGFQYTAVGSQGSRTQGQFFSAQTPGRVLFNFSVTGSASTPYGLALGRLDFLARPFVSGSGSFFDVFGGGALHAVGANTYSFEYIGSTASPLDILFFSSAAVIASGAPTGASFNASANFASTFDLTSIELFDTAGGQITDWSLVDMAKKRVVFDENGRVAATVSEPTGLAWVVIGLSLVAFRRRRIR